MRPARLEEIRALIEKKSAMHPELRRPLGLAGFRRVLKRERVELVVRPHPRIAQLIPQLAGWSIVVDKRQPAEARLLCGCHELAHLWLHHDPYFGRYETSIYDHSPPWYDDIREQEADAFAEMLVRGPERDSVHESEPAHRSVSNSRRVSKKAKSKQLELADPDGDAFLAMVKQAPKDPLPPADPSPVVQFTIPKDVCRSVRLHAVRRRAGHSTYRDNLGDSVGDSQLELVTCSETVALAIVDDLAKQGLKRDAAKVRRTIRETRRAREQTR